MNALDAARQYASRGWAPIPIPVRTKRPKLKDWPNLRLTAGDCDGHFNGAPQNIGIILGQASGGLADVDLDCPEAVAVAPYLLPPTRSIFGRPSAPGSHWLYLVAEAGERATTKYVDPGIGGDRAAIVELRRGGGKGAQTIFPPSIHPSGEAIAWAADEAPSVITADDLERRVRLVAVAAIIARCWPAEGARHERALRLGGFLHRAGIDERTAKLMAEAIARAAGDPDWKDRVAAMTVAPGAQVAGFPKLADWIGERRAKAVAGWLGYSDTSDNALAINHAAGVEDGAEPGRSTLDTVMPRLLERYALTPDGRIMDVLGNSESLWSLDALKRLWGRYDVPGPRGGLHSVIDPWSRHRDRMVLDKPVKLLDPRYPLGLVETGRTDTGRIGWVNAYRPRPLAVREPQPEDQAHVESFLQHVRWTWPDEGTERWLDWAASKLQNPERRQFALASFTPMPGTGRTSLALMLARLLGDRVHALVSMGVLLKDFNSHLLKLLIVVNEAAAQPVDNRGYQRRTSAIDQIHEQIEVGPGENMIRLMRTDQFSTETFHSWLIHSNRTNALAFERDERRIEPHLGNTQRMPNEIAAFVHGCNEGKNPAGMDAVHRMLLARQVDHFRYWETVETVATRRIVEASLSPFDDAMEEFLEVLGRPAVVTAYGLREAAECVEMRKHVPDAYHAVHALSESERCNRLFSWMKANTRSPRCLGSNRGKPTMKVNGVRYLPRILNHPRVGPDREIDLKRPTLRAGLEHFNDLVDLFVRTGHLNVVGLRAVQSSEEG